MAGYNSTIEPDDEPKDFVILSNRVKLVFFAIIVVLSFLILGVK